jgi:hypothetical protein
MSNPIGAIGKGIEHVGQDIWHFITGAGHKFLTLLRAGKLVTVASYGEQTVTDGAAKIATLIDDAVKLGEAVAKDDAASLVALEAIVAAAAKAGANKLENITEDAALFAAVVTFLKTCASANYTEVIAAVKAVITSAGSVDVTVENDIKKLIVDAK